MPFTFPPIMIVLGVHDLFGSFLMPDKETNVKVFLLSESTLVKRLLVKGAALTVVQCDDVQAVEQLPLVLMDPLHLDIEHGTAVDLYLVVLFEIGSKLHLVLLKVAVAQRNVIRDKQTKRRRK